MSSMRLDDLWLAGFLVAQGARLKTVAVLPYSNGRLQAFFELEDVPGQALESYAQEDPQVAVHALRAALNELREAMRKAMEQRNGNGNHNTNHHQNNHRQPETNQTRSVTNEQNTPGDNRSDQGNNRSGGLHRPVRKAR